MNECMYVSASMYECLQELLARGHNPLNFNLVGQPYVQGQGLGYRVRIRVSLRVMIRVRVGFGLGLG